MHSKIYDCVVTEAFFMTPTVMKIVFKPKKKITFLPGQFLSILIPSNKKGEAPTKRLYSFASSPEDSTKFGYELCVKYVAGGKGSEFLAALRVGDHFRVGASYGTFTYQASQSDRNVCFIGTGTGIAPLRSILKSKLFLDNRPEKVHAIFGVRNEEEILFQSDFAGENIHLEYTLSQPTSAWTGFKGRVVDFLRSGKNGIDWHSTDFYLCGSGAMVEEAVNLLKSYGVKDSAIFKENFSPVQGKVLPFTKPLEQESEEKDIASSLLHLLRIAK